MKKLLIPILAATALISAAAPASAAPWRGVNERQARLDHRIDMAVRHHRISFREARALRGEFRQIARLEANYRRTGGGLSGWERADLDRRFDQLSFRIRYEVADRDGRRW